MTSQLTLPGVCDGTVTGLTVADGTDYDTVVAICARVFPVAASLPWWVGDLIVYLEARWGQTEGGMAMIRRELVELSNIDPQSLARMRHMAVLVPPERRREELSYSHHVEVAKLEPEDQVRLLALAAEGDVDAVTGRWYRWPVERLRREVRRVRDLEAGDPLPGLPASSRPLRVMVPRETLRVALPALVDAVRVLPAGEGRAAVMELVELLEREAS